MIEFTTANGRPASISYFDAGFVPCHKDVAKLLKVIFLDSDALETLFLTPDEEAPVAGSLGTLLLGKFDESQPRDEKGRWSESGATGVTYDKETKEWFRGDGSSLSKEDHARMAEARVPPGWHDVHLNPDPKGALQVIGKDDKDRWQRRYSAEHSEAAAAEKFARLKEFNAALPELRASIARDVGKLDAATALAIIDKTGFRVGGEEDTGGKVKAFGISTLEGQHVKVDGDKVTLTFIGKAGKLNEKEFTDANIAKAIRDKGPAAGTRLFRTDDESIRDYLHKIGGDEFKTKDFRTWHGTATALEALKPIPIPKGDKEFARVQRDVAKAVAAHLGNTPSVALKYYIDPAVWQKWKPK